MTYCMAVAMLNLFSELFVTFDSSGSCLTLLVVTALSLMLAYLAAFTLCAATVISFVLAYGALSTLLAAIVLSHDKDPLRPQDKLEIKPC